MALSDLKPCPFCGEPPTSYPSGDGSGTMIECINRHCVGPHVSHYGKGVAERVWNTRAEPDERVKGLVEALERIASDHIKEEPSVYARAGHFYHADCDACHRQEIAREALSSYQDKRP